MYNRCPHFNEGILPIFPIKSTTSTTTTNELFHGGAIIKLSIYFIISLLILLPRKSLAAGLQYETAYACEGKTLTISCDPGYLISLIRANYGRFSITICNDHGNVEWSVNCMSPKSLRVLHSKCTHKQNCSVLASTNMFGDPCPGTHKYLEAHYQCISAAQTSTTTTRPSPPWLITNSPNIWSTSTIPATVTSSMKSTSGHQTPTTARIGSIHQMVLPQKPPPQSKGAETPGTSQGSGGTSTGTAGTSQTNIHLAGGRPPIVDPFDTRGSASRPTNTPFSNRGGVLQSSRTSVNSSSPAGEVSENGADSGTFNRTQSTPSDDAGRHESQDQSKHTNRNEDNSIYNQQTLTTQSPSVLVNNNNNNYDGSIDSGYYCGPTTMRNLFWNVTRVGEVNVQPCPGGAFGIAKWRCVLQQIASSSNRSDVQMILSDCASRSCETQHQLSSSRNSPHRAVWHPLTPDLTQCRSVWINNLEISVNQRDSSLISIANDLSQITSSKTLYGGDMLVTTKIIQTMSEKMAYDIETFPDQKQREAIITELLSGVVKTGSNLLDISHKHTWLDLSFEDQMRVATSLLTGLEDNAFLLADSIIRERTVVQKVKNILLSIRVLETRNIVGNEVFPDGKVEQWDVSEDRIELPRGALVENSEAGLVRIVFVAFDRLETILKPWLNHLDVKFTKGEMQRNHSKNTAGIQQNRILNSKVISASLGKGRHIQLSQPIRLILRHLKVENVTNPVCVFWNYIDHAWSEDGCYLEHTNHSHTICMCNHLTNFAILMDTTDDTAPSLLSLFNNNIRILIYISIAICIIFIIVAILTLKLFNGIFVKVRRRTDESSEQNNHASNSNSSSSNLNHQTVNNINNSRNIRNASNLSNNDNINNSLVVEMVTSGRMGSGRGPQQLPRQQQTQSSYQQQQGTAVGGSSVNAAGSGSATVALAAEFQQRLLSLPNFVLSPSRGQQNNNHHLLLHTHHPHSNNHSMIVNNSLGSNNSNLINYKNTNACNAILFATSSLVENNGGVDNSSNVVVAPINIGSRTKPNVLYD